MSFGAWGRVVTVLDSLSNVQRPRRGRDPGEYDFRTQKARVTVTVRRETLAKAERQVRRGRAKSVSAWGDSAMEEKARREDLATLLAEMQAENGPATAKEEAWARAVLGL